MYGAEVMTMTVSGGMGLIPVGGTVVTLPQLAGAFLLVAGTVTSQNLLFQMREVLMFCISGKEMGAPTGNWLYDSVRELTEMASTQFAFYGLMNPYTYQRPKITLLPNETGLTVPGGTGVAVVPNGTAPALKQPYLPGQYSEYPAAVQGWAQQALPGGGSGIETSYGKSTLNSLKNTENFTDSAIEHIFEGQVNARGKAVGYHYKGIEGTSGNVIPGTESSVNNIGIYKAKVEVNGVPKTANGGFSSFYPKSMSPQEVIGSINEAYRNRVYIRGNTYSGLTSSGMEIEMFLDKNGKIISAYPVY